MLKATVNVVASFALPCSWACLAPRRPPDLVHREEPAGRLVDVHDAVCAHCVCDISQHSLMNSRCELASCRAGLWSSFKHLAGFLKLKRMPRKSCLTQVSPGRTSSPSASSHSYTKPLIVTPLRHSTSVTFMMCSLSRVKSAGRQHNSSAASLLVARSSSSDRSVRVDPNEQLGAQTLDLAQAPLHIPSSFGSPLVQHVEEPVAGDGVDVDLAAIRTTAGLVFSECGGTGSPDVGELLMCERVDGFSWSPPGRALQADTMRELVVVEDVLLKSAFPELPTARLCVPVWWPTQTNRQGAGGPPSKARSRLNDEEERLLTKRSIEWHRANNWETLFEGEKAENKIICRPRQRPHCFSWKQTCLMTVHTAHVPR